MATYFDQCDLRNGGKSRKLTPSFFALLMVIKSNLEPEDPADPYFVKKLSGLSRSFTKDSTLSFCQESLKLPVNTSSL